MTLPYRESLANFQRYSPFIASALLRYPQAIVLTPTYTAVTTFQARCKDALVFGLRHDHYLKVPAFPADKFLLLAARLQVSVRGNEVAIGEAEAVKTIWKEKYNDPGVEHTETQVSQTEYEFTATDTVELWSFLECLAFIHPRLKVFVKNLDPELKELIEKRMDFIFQPSPDDPNKFYII